MFRHIILAMALVGAGTTMAQGLMSDLMNGKLVSTEVGAFAWYTLKDTATGREFFLRQAIVGEEKVKRKTAYWLETELVPRVGFPSVYKMLLTGPASDPENVHRLLVREGDGLVQEVALEQGERAGADPELPREAAGTETISLPGGDIETEHFIVGEGDERAEIWVSDAVPPMGLVKLQTAQGELMLQRYGVGGKDGASALGGSTPPRTDAEEPVPDRDPEMEIEAEAETETATPEPQEDAVEPDRNSRVRTNFGGRKIGRRP